VFVKKRIAAILAIAVTTAIGASSSAQASGDPVWVGTDLLNQLQCTITHPNCPPGPRTIVSVNALLGPSLGDALCTPEGQIPVGDPNSTGIVVCKQPSG
jgi:hypothetical protein